MTGLFSKGKYTRLLKQPSHAPDHEGDASRLELPLAVVLLWIRFTTRPKEWKTRSQRHQMEMSPTDRSRIIKRQSMPEAKLTILDLFLFNKAGL